jgi:PAS domain S-box-containing protein
MDWETIVSNIAHAQPALVVDGAQRVRFLNQPMETLLGWSADELSSRSWVTVCVAQGERASARQLIAEGMNGGTTNGEMHLKTRGGRRLAAKVELAPQSQGRVRGLVIVAREVGDSVAPHRPARDCSFEVARGASHGGLVQAVRFLDPSLDGSEYVGLPFDVLLREAGSAEAHGSVNSVIEAQSTHAAQVLLHDVDDGFHIVSARVLGGDIVRVTVRCVDSHMLPDLVDAKVARVAEANGLSDRERQVLQLLLRGRGVEDIATMLEIAPRTVKFHQANVLQKLGADSRLDLLRVVL